MKKETDWISWTLHALLGAFIGAVLGFAIITRRRHGFWLDDTLIHPFIIASALVGVGIGSMFGDKLWLGDNYKMFPPDAPKTTGFSKALSVLFIGAGLLVSMAIIARHFKMI